MILSLESASNAWTDGLVTVAIPNVVNPYTEEIANSNVIPVPIKSATLNPESV